MVSNLRVCFGYVSGIFGIFPVFVYASKNRRDGGFEPQGFFLAFFNCFHYCICSSKNELEKHTRKQYRKTYRKQIRKNLQARNHPCGKQMVPIHDLILLHFMLSSRSKYWKIPEIPGTIWTKYSKTKTL